MAKLLEGKVAVVTGASQGLGLAIAAALNLDGANVLLVSRREDELVKVVEDVRKGGAGAEYLVLDITQPDSGAKIVEEARKKFGGVDILLNNAGVFVWQKFFELSPDEWNRTLSTNLSAPFFLTQAVAQAMANQGRGGSIINIASVHGEIGDPNVVPHCASKFGLVGLTKATSEALREHGIRVNAIAPGAIDPDSAGRRGESLQSKVTQADIATLAVYLSSDLSRSITGSVIDMYGSTRAVIKA